MAAPPSTTGTNSRTALHHYRGLNSEVRAYVDAVRIVVHKFSVLRPTEQRKAFWRTDGVLDDTSSPKPVDAVAAATDPLLDLARATAQDGEQRALGASSPEQLISLREPARAAIGTLPSDDLTRFVMPWVWDVASSGGQCPHARGRGVRLRASLLPLQVGSDQALTWPLLRHDLGGSLTAH